MPRKMVGVGHGTFSGTFPSEASGGPLTLPGSIEFSETLRSVALDPTGGAAPSPIFEFNPDDYATTTALNNAAIWSGGVNTDQITLDTTDGTGGASSSMLFTFATFPDNDVNADSDYYVKREVQIESYDAALFEWWYEAYFKFSRGYASTLPGSGFLWTRDQTGNFTVGETISWTGGNVTLEAKLEGGTFPVASVDAALYWHQPVSYTPPVDGQTVTGGTSGATATVHGGWTEGKSTRRDHKFMRMKTPPNSSYYAVNLGNGFGPDTFCNFLSGGFGSPNAVVTGPGWSSVPLWDGEWHLLRVHGRAASADETIAAYIDGEVDGGSFVGNSVTGSTTDRRRGRFMSFNENRNTRVLASNPMWQKWGPVRVYNTDPGWGI